MTRWIAVLAALTIGVASSGAAYARVAVSGITDDVASVGSRFEHVLSACPAKRWDAERAAEPREMDNLSAALASPLLCRFH